LPKLKMFSGYDKKLKHWNPPFLLMHAGQAERTWVEIANDPKSMVSKHPNDFDLYMIGEFDDVDAQLYPVTPPMLIMSAIDAKAKAEPTLPFDGVSR